ncbi:MAG TPA: hypothetical protein VMB72_09805, partial [Acidimicrobiales bacterium]|nr:hypothetical protein [Acidimicrobiales bacterium]
MSVLGVWCDDAVWFGPSPTAGTNPDLERFTGAVQATSDGDLPVAFAAADACFSVALQRVVALNEADVVGPPPGGISGRAP